MSSEDEIDIDAGDELLIHPWLQFPVGTASHEKCSKFLRMKIGVQKAIDWDLLEELGETDRARAITGEDTPWTRLFEIAFSPSYRLITVEFLSTFIYQPNQDQDDEPEIWFTLCGVPRALTMRQWAVICGCYYEPETVTPLYTDGITVIDEAVLRHWWLTIGKRPFGSKARVSRIRDPLIRYLHRCIATSITGRGKSCEWCTIQDLFFLYCLVTRRTCHLARCLADYFASYYHRQERGRIHGGAYVTHIARSFGLIDFQPVNMEPVGPARLDRRTAYGMRIIREFPGIGIRFSLRANVIWQPGQRDSDDQQEQEQEQEQQAHQQPQDPPPQFEPQQPPEPPQYPRHIYRAVRLPAGVETAIQEIRTATRHHSRRIDRIEDIMEWQVEVERRRARAAGYDLPDFPPPRVYPPSP